MVHNNEYQTRKHNRVLAEVLKLSNNISCIYLEKQFAEKKKKKRRTLFRFLVKRNEINPHEKNNRENINSKNKSLSYGALVCCFNN